MTKQRNPWLILVVLCLAVFTILVDTNIVNVALPTLVGELNASTRDLLWIVDAYNLTFAAFVLAAGSLADRYGRKQALLTGLVIFGAGTTVGAFLDSSTQLTVARAVMGLGAAVIFPTTLSIITNVFPDRKERAKAIGIWGATTGLAVAFSPIVGGFLLEHFWWGSVFLAMTPLALIAFLLTWWLVPGSSDPSTPALDKPGLVLSTAGLGLLVYTIIEAPERGWAAPITLIGFALTLITLAIFVRHEKRCAEPMLDIALFANLRFSAASGSVAVAFFALFGFVFLVTQYMQFLRGYSPFETGLRIIPVAVAVGSASVIGTSLAVRFGNRSVIGAGLALLSIGFLWTTGLSRATSYAEIVGQMILIGLGMGLTAAPATEAIMSVVPPEKAGIGSAVNDATRELGGTLGVAVLGSVFATIYTGALNDAPVAASLSADAVHTAEDGIGAAQAVAAQLPADLAAQLQIAASQGFLDGFHASSLVAALVAATGCLFALRFLPGGAAPQPARSEAEMQPAAV